MVMEKVSPLHNVYLVTAAIDVAFLSGKIAGAWRDFAELWIRINWW